MRHRTVTLMLATAVALPATMLLGTGPASAIRATCEGQRATIVAGPGEAVQGTSDMDVVVATSPASVSTGGGADLVCIEGTVSPDVAIDLGGSYDRLVWLEAPPALTVPVIGGGDVDDAWVQPVRGNDVRLDAAAGTLHVDGQLVARPQGFHDFELTTPDETPMTIGFTGTGASDDLTIDSTVDHTVQVDTGAALDIVSLSFAPAAGSRVDLGRGSDWFSFLAPGADVDLDLPAGRLTYGDGGTVAVTGVERGSFTADDLRVVGGAEDNQIYYLACRAVIRAGAGDDFVNPESQRKHLTCPTWTATVHGGPGGDNITGTDGDDSLLGGRGHDVIAGRDGDDVLRGGAGRDDLSGGRGRDRLDGGRDNDRLAGHQGPDVLIGGPGRDVARGGPGRDRCRAERTHRCER